MEHAQSKRTVVLRFLIIAGTVSVVHFALSILSIFEGFTIFRSAATPGEIFWEKTMEVMLFPADVLFTSAGSQWAQTVAIAGNSVLWGCVVAAAWQIVRAKRRDGRHAI